MQSYGIAISSLLMLLVPCVHAYLNITFSKDTTIAHPETGLFLDYVGLYTPSETIIHNSVIFPLTVSLCHLLPVSAAEKIPSCNITRMRTKRLVDSIISVAVGTAALGISMSNAMQIGNLQRQVAVVENTLFKFSQTVKIHEAQLAKLTLKHIELAEELEATQGILQDMAPIIGAHSVGINNLKTDVGKVQGQLQHSFLNLAITQISNNKLTLEFLLPEDMHKVVYNVIERGNLTFNHYHDSLPVVQIVTRLLVRQQIDFVSSSQYITDDVDEIGRLVITSYFAVPKPAQTPFYVFKLVTVPFFHENETIQLAHIPRYWAINLVTNATMEWQDPQESGCDLRLMTSCRDTPAIRKISRDTCFDEIIGKRPLSKCHTIPVPTADYFVQHLRDNYWITSTPKPLNCVKAPRAEDLNAVQQIDDVNEEIILPSVSLVNVTEGYAVLCPGFTLLGRALTSNVSSLVILHNSSILAKGVSVLNVHQFITKNVTWFRKKMSEWEKSELTDFVRKTASVSTDGTLLPSGMNYFGFLSSAWIFFGLVFVLLYCFCRRK